MDWEVFYIIGKLLKRRCLKWAWITHLDIWNTSYGQKKGQKSNWQFDPRPLKVRNRLDLLVLRRRVTYRWKDIDDGYNFALDLISIRGLHTKLWVPKVAGVPTLAISRLPLGSPGTKCHLDVGLVERHKVYYKGEGGRFPQVVMSLVNLNCTWLILASQVLQLCINHFVLVLCKLVWVSEACQFFLVPSQSSSMPFYPSKVLWAKERAPTFCSFVVFCLGLTLEPLKELGAHHLRNLNQINTYLNGIHQII